MEETTKLVNILDLVDPVRLCRFCRRPLPTGKFSCDDPACLRDQERRSAADRGREIQEKAERRRTAERERLKRLYAGDNFAEIYLDAEFNGLLVDGGNEDAIHGAMIWARDFGGPRMKSRALWLFGDTGRGKTRLAYCVANHLMRRGVSMAYFSVRSGLDDLYVNPRDDDSRRRTVQARLDALKGARCVLVDDLGYEGDKPPEPFLRFLHGLVDRQYIHADRGLILTSELTPKDLQPQGDLFRGGRYGDGTSSLLGRLREMSGRSAYQLFGDDWRTPPDGKPPRRETAKPFQVWLEGRKNP